ncbi:Alkyl hydroperoxide reductase and/or thiol-specific antioxidant family (AhpC/TSA) protein [Thioalkalivibrio nitratireducens DSM 14787]|uniref:Alkyl hydroperoxide reductase and/or thiol-specific antioxidant family (AhpC/TSA) protein n=1 Tax=Thioalkalivibrio nitratireducens (strain DSM 14787 / UNIQEM 213 / ALEN2) TaxID=1255043 RepID=L0DRN4_THIND|nr:thioredoxin family protein [Thioalkalivibrio nitratireducens]AGA32249.1 Alkyl hydroperoxide reductase and/or thiol-specific antioxidant family (AhpC/TSA) protein [Thioalkalivibrio nitratireducens DSM 14787]
MARTPSQMIDLGTEAPNFRLPDVVSGNTIGLDAFPDAKGFMIAFICNHCPFVQLIRHEFARYGREYSDKGIAVIAINSNDIQAHPEDGPDAMRDDARRFGYTFPYCLDEAQSVARAYQAACTPDLYLFDANRKLVYRGQFDDARPGSEIPVTGNDLRAATDALLAGQAVATEQKASLGCNIKWKPGNEPDYYG